MPWPLLLKNAPAVYQAANVSEICKCTTDQSDVEKNPNWSYLSSIGITKAAVFPDPVLAMPTTSWPVRAKGKVRLWMGVGSWKPFRLIPLMITGLKPSVSAQQ